MSLISIARVNFEYKSVITTIKRLSDLFFGSGPRMFITTYSNGPLAGKRGTCFCDFVGALWDFTKDSQSHTVSKHSLTINPQYNFRLI